MSYKRVFKNALSDASDWQKFMTEDETNRTYNDAKEICLKRIYDEYIDDISQ